MRKMSDNIVIRSDEATANELDRIYDEMIKECEVEITRGACIRRLLRLGCKAWREGMRKSSDE